MACSVGEVAKLSSHTLYIGEPHEVFTEEKYLTDNQPDIRKIDPFVLTMPTNRYWAVGECLGGSMADRHVL